MANPNNLIRPPILNLPNQGSPPPQANRNSNQDIIEIVNRLLDERATTRNTVEVDQPINIGTVDNIGELDKIPDVVRCLRDFSGDPKEFGSWKKSIDRILQMYEPIRGSHKYYGILSVIRNKITGQADIVLESYNTPLNWSAISRCLTTHYGDKRDLGTLEYQMTSLIQGHLSIQEFYKQVYTNLSLILNKITCFDAGIESKNLLISTYRNKALDTFIRGLNGDLHRLLGIREPTDLPEALQLCLKLENQAFRTNVARKTTHHEPPVPQRKNFNQPFYPNLIHWPQPMQRHIPQTANYNPYFTPRQFQQQPLPQNYHSQPQNYGNYHLAPPRPFGPKPLPRPEPMDVDQSLQSRNINYMNRPTPNYGFIGKRPPPANNHHKPMDKKQRNFNIVTQQYDETNEPSEEDYDQSLSEYIRSFPIENYEENEDQASDAEALEKLDSTDINFLG